jgi:predicted Zn-dependent peptidase
VLTPQQMARVRDILRRDADKNRLDNGYLLNEIARRYEDGEAAGLAIVDEQAAEIATLDAAAVHQAASTYLDLNNYVQVILLPEKR